MTRDEIIQMAREACWEGYRNDDSFVKNEFILGSIDNLERFYKKAYEAGAKAEPVACTPDCLDHDEDCAPPHDYVACWTYAPERGMCPYLRIGQRHPTR